MTWACTICGVKHDGLPDCFGAQAPWPALVPEDEFAARVFLSDDQCVVDDKHFFVRGHVEIPIHGHTNPLAFSVWSSLSEASFLHVEERWVDPEREGDTYFGWLSSPIPAYTDTINLKLNVNSRVPGLTPLLHVQNDDHPLALDQRNGISVKRWHQMALQILEGN